MKPAVVMIPSMYPKASEPIFRAIGKSLTEAGHEVLILAKADRKKLESKALKIKSKILIGKSYGGKLAIEFQLTHKNVKALVLLAPAVEGKAQFRQISIPD